MHGWWEKKGVPKPTKATKAVVQVWLQAQSPVDHKWRNVGYGKGTYSPGPGSGKWANARVTCKVGPIAGPYKFRAEVDVDLVGYADSPERVYGATAAYNCLP